MSLPHRPYLASQILSDQQTISYRTLSRALKVHVNAAKRMLYEFHSHENAKNPSSVHATYLLAGIKKPNLGDKEQKLGGQQNGNHRDIDEPMPSSPPPFTSSMLNSSPPDQKQDDSGQDGEVISVRTITLAREESLDAVKSSYDSISSIHIYSLSPHRLPDMQTLSDAGRHLYETYFVKEDPLEHNATYGVILNKNVRRRTGRRPPPPSALPAQVKQAAKPEKALTAPSKPSRATAAETPPQPSHQKEDTSSRTSSAGSATVPAPTSTASSTAKQPALKRDTSDIFKSFAKAKTKSAPKLARNDTDSSAGGGDASNTEGKNEVHPNNTTRVGNEDEEGESEEEALFPNTKTGSPATKRPSAGGNSRAERQAKLRKMMDDDDDDDEEEEMKDDNETEEEATELIDPEQAGLGQGDQPRKDGKDPTTATATSNQPTGHESQPRNSSDNDDNESEVDWSNSDTEQKPNKASTNNNNNTTKNNQKPKTNPTSKTPQQPPDPSTRTRTRRLRRKVLKTKTVKDEDGYLVTRQEPVWESFSEDEGQGGKARSVSATASAPAGASTLVAAAAAAATSSAPSAKAGAKEKEKEKGKGGRGGGGGSGSGGIMSFFQKK